MNLPVGTTHEAFVVVVAVKFGPKGSCLYKLNSVRIVFKRIVGEASDVSFTRLRGQIFDEVITPGTQMQENTEGWINSTRFVLPTVSVCS